MNQERKKVLTKAAKAVQKSNKGLRGTSSKIRLRVAPTGGANLENYAKVITYIAKSDHDQISMMIASTSSTTKPRKSKK